MPAYKRGASTKPASKTGRGGAQGKKPAQKARPNPPKAPNPPGPDGPGSSAPWTSRLVGPGGQLFGDPAPTPDETAFQVDNTSDAYYSSPYYAQHAKQVLAVPMGPPT